MASTSVMNERLSLNEIQKKHYIGGIRFDRVITIFICWFLGGLFLDAWAHNHGLVDKTFFTPWHAVLYSGYAACAFVLVATVFINHLRGYSWQEAIPGGYELSLLGVPLFLAAGVGDMIWHILFGFEVGIEPLLSPTHLVLAFSGLLIMSGPFRAAWRRADPVSTNNWATLFPAIISLTAILSLLTFFTSFAHPFVQTGLVTDTFVGDGEKSRGAAAILLQAGILMGVILLALRRWRLPVGASSHTARSIAPLRIHGTSGLLPRLLHTPYDPQWWDPLVDPPVARFDCDGRRCRAGTQLPAGAPAGTR